MVKTLNQNLAIPASIWRATIFAFIVVYPFLVLPLPGNSENVWSLPRVVFLACLGLLGLLQTTQIREYKNAFSLLLLGYLGLVFLSCLNARDDWQYIILGNAERTDGLLYQVALILFALFIYRQLRLVPQSLQGYMYTLMFAGLVQTVIVTLEAAGFNILGTLTHQKTYEAPYGTFGHTGFAGGFFLPIVIFALWWSHFKAKGNYRIFVFVCLLATAFGLGIVANRAASFSLLCVLLLANVQLRNFRFLGLSLLVVSCIYLGGYSMSQSTAFTSGHAGKKYTNTSTLKTRLAIWDIALDALRLIPYQPFIGGGPDAFRLTLLRHFSVEQMARFYRLEDGWPENAEIKSSELIFDEGNPIRTKAFLVLFRQFGDEQETYRIMRFTLDKAHNFYLDRFLAYGGLSTLVWLIVYLYPVGLGLLSQSQSPERAFAWVLLAISIYHLAWFSVVQVEPIHMLFVAAAWALLSCNRQRATLM